MCLALSPSEVLRYFWSVPVRSPFLWEWVPHVDFSPVATLDDPAPARNPGRTAGPARSSLGGLDFGSEAEGT